MNIIIYDTEKFQVDQLHNLMDVIKKVSNSRDWIALPKGVNVIQDAPVEYLEHYRDMLDEQIKKYKETENERS
jgi:hypothetical protein